MDEPEENRNLPVLASVPEARAIERLPEQPMPLTAPAAAATGGAIVGFTALLLMRILRRSHERRGSPVRLGGRRGQKLEIAGSRTFLVDVHVLKR